MRSDEAVTAQIATCARCVPDAKSWDKEQWRNDEPGYGFPVLESLGYMDPRTGKWQVDMPEPLVPEVGP